MTKEEKTLIYDLLKKADANISGFTSDGFKGEVEFVDEIVGSSPTMTQTVEPAVVPEPVEGQPAESPSTSSGTPDSSAAMDNSSNTSALTLTDLYAKITRCTKCQLARTRNNVVPGEGVENPDVLVIGEGPGYDEDMSGRPFVGKAGVLLDKMLAAIELDRNKNCYIANIVKCRPPNNRDPEPEEQSTCFAFLQAQLHILKPKMILCMGRIAGHKMLDTQESLNKLRGQIFDYNGIPLMVTYHPSALLRDQSLKAPAWQDLKTFKKKLDEIRSK